MTADQIREKAREWPQLERLRDFVAMVTEWTAKFPLKGEASKEDSDAALEIYCCCEGAEENIYELRQSLAGERLAGRLEGLGRSGENFRCEFLGSHRLFV